MSCWMVRKQRGPGAARGAPRGEGTAEAPPHAPTRGGFCLLQLLLSPTERNLKKKGRRGTVFARLTSHSLPGAACQQVGELRHRLGTATAPRATRTRPRPSSDLPKHDREDSRSKTRQGACRQPQVSAISSLPAQLGGFVPPEELPDQRDAPALGSCKLKVPGGPEPGFCHLPPERQRRLEAALKDPVTRGRPPLRKKCFTRDLLAPTQNTPDKSPSETFLVLNSRQPYRNSLAEGALKVPSAFCFTCP